MNGSRGWPTWLPRLAVESVVVVFSILLALVVNEWRQEAEREDRRERATAAIRAELLHNYREVREVHPYHGRLADTLMALAGAGAGSADPGVRPRGWIRNADVVRAAWEAAGASGATSDLPYGALLALSRAYEEQAAFRRQKESLAEAVVGMALDRDSPLSLLENPGGMALVLNTLQQWEANLLREYERALTDLGVPADSLEASAGAPGEASGGAAGDGTPPGG